MTWHYAKPQPTMHDLLVECMGGRDKPSHKCEKCGERVYLGDWPFCPHEKTRKVGEDK